MVVTNYSDARAHLAALMDKVTEDAEEVRITRRGKPDVVLIAADELESIKETAYLLRSPANRERLLAAIEAARRGEGVRVTDEDLAAMKQEVKALVGRGELGGTSSTLERLMADDTADAAAEVARVG